MTGGRRIAAVVGGAGLLVALVLGLFGAPASASDHQSRAQVDKLLIIAAPHLTVVAFAQGLAADGRRAVVQRLAAVGRRRQWPPLLDADEGAARR